MPPSPPPRRQRVLTFVSPKVADLIFYELRDGRLAKYKNPPAYGTAHPDTRVYPNHKLVFITPASASEDGWQKWYYAAAREAQDDYNFEIDGDTSLVRTYIYPRADYLAGRPSAPTYAAPALGTADTVFTSFKFRDEKVKRTGDQVIDSYFIVIQRHFFSDEKMSAVAQSGSSQGETGSVTTRDADRLAYAPEPGIILQRSSRLTSEEMWDNTENRLALRAGVNNTSIVNRVGYTETDTSELSHNEPTSNLEPSFSKRVVTTDVDGADAVWASSRKTRASSPANGSDMVTFLGGGISDVDVRLVAATDTADSGFLVLSSQVSPLGNGDAIKTTKTLQGGYPVLTEERYDSQLDGILTITKEVIVPGTANGSSSYGNIVEIQPVDKWRSIKITTSASSSVVRTEILPGVFNYRFPPVLKRLGFYWTYAYAGSQGSNYDQDRDAALVFVVEEAFSAACKGRIRRVITGSPESVVEENPVVNFKPQSHTIAMLNAYAYSSSKTTWAKANVRTWQTPMALHSNLSIEGGPGWPQQGLSQLAIDDQYTSQLPATSPTDLPSEGTLMTIGVETRRLKLGYWEVLIKEIYSPGSSYSATLPTVQRIVGDTT